MTRLRSLRARLVLLFVVLAGAAVTLAGAGMIVLLDRAVWGTLDAALEEEAHTILVLAAKSDSDEREVGPGAEELQELVSRIGAERDLGEGKFIYVFGPDGAVRERSGLLPEAVSAAAPRRRLGEPQATLAGDAQPYRAIWHETADGGWVAIGVRADRQLRVLRRGRWAVMAGASLLVATLAVLGWALASRATGELDRMANELESIEADSLHRRVERHETSEVDRLAEVLNRLLTRLDAAVHQLRRFTADAAHELRTPIAALRAHLEVALSRPASAGGDRDGLLDGLEQAERLGRLAEDLLTLSSIESGALAGKMGAERVRLDQLAQEVAEFLEPVAQEQGRRFELSIKGPVVARGSAGLLKRLMINLLDNAFQHTPPSAPVAFEVYQTGGKASIRVRDGGPGAEGAEVERWFQRFFRGSTTATGAGLGLSLCREIVERHRGRILIESSPRGGTIAVVELPAT